MPPIETQIRLSELLKGHDNNLNLIRAVAAMMVLVSHSFAIVTGDVGREPMRATHGLTLGSVAVDVFFIVSGLLVTRSIMMRGNAEAFIRARALRILPGLFVSLLMLAYVIGPSLTTIPAPDYLISDAALKFVANGMILQSSMLSLPGLFEGNPFGAVANLSLWTLPLEVRMYAYLLAIWLVAQFARRWKREAFTTVVVCAFTYYALRHFSSHSSAVESSAARLPFNFFTGSMVAIFAGHITLSARRLVGALTVIFVGAAVGGSAFFVAYSATLWLVVLWLAYRPRGLVRSFNKTGDYSYGLYVYAWPVQQMAIHLMPGLSVAAHIAISAVTTLLLAIASWHLVEQPAMRFRSTRRAVPGPA